MHRLSGWDGFILKIYFWFTTWWLAFVNFGLSGDLWSLEKDVHTRCASRSGFECSLDNLLKLVIWHNDIDLFSRALASQPQNVFALNGDVALVVHLTDEIVYARRRLSSRASSNWATTSGTAFRNGYVRSTSWVNDLGRRLGSRNWIRVLGKGVGRR
jgi:hypothetical protein